MYVNSHLGKGKAPATINDFLPNYIGEEKQTSTEKSLAQQRLEKEAFKEKLKEVKRIINK